MLANAPVKTARVCFYCDSADGAFWMDAVPGRRGLFVASGDSGHAFKFAPVLGELIADRVERRANPILSRYGARTAGSESRDSARAVEVTSRR